MAADPFVAPTLDDTPRQQPNLAPGVHMPAARPWRPDRPGDVVAYGQPHGKLLGDPGPNIGYALTLALRLHDKVQLAPTEHLDDAIAVVSELAMKRAASYGRAPVMADLEAAALILGYLGGCDPDDALWRVEAVTEAAHDYPARRAVCDAVDLDALRLAPSVLTSRTRELRSQVRAAWRPGDA
ncbi:MAG TPA: hypothetical protein VLV81_01670 [Acidimicrobiia bacterium]|nr:hypothetical protein [Acidimicrobiia bacterium]